jgi:hypothetical protein
MTGPMVNVEKLKALVEAAAEDMSFMLVNPAKPKAKPWRVVHVDELVRRALPLCKFARNCEKHPDLVLAARAHAALEFFLQGDAMPEDEAGGGA